MRNALEGGIDLSLLERSNHMIKTYQKEIEDKANEEYIKQMKNRKPCPLCGTLAESHFCTGEPKNAKYFEIEQIIEEDLPKGNYQIGMKL